MKFRIYFVFDSDLDAIILVQAIAKEVNAQSEKAVSEWWIWY